MKDKIAEVNKILLDGEPGNIQEDKRGGRTVNGYDPQSVIDAVNEGLGTENWMYELIHYGAVAQGKVFNGQVIIQLSIKVGGDWVTHGPIAGAQPNPSEYDAIKGAITDALKKAFSHFSIGAKAYRGELNKVPSAVKDDIKAIRKDTGDGITEPQRRAIFAISKDLGYEPDDFKKQWLTPKYKVTSTNELTKNQATEIIKKLKAAQAKAEPSEDGYGGDF